MEQATSDRDDRNASLYALIASASGTLPANELVQRALQAMRSHLGMDVAYVSEFEGNRSIFRVVDAPGLEQVVKPGDSLSLDDVYCRHILEGRLPQLMADTADEPLAVATPITRAIPVGKHVSVPIRMPDGSVYGMFCCLGFTADRSLRERDLQMLKVFADLVAFEIGRDFAVAKAAREKEQRIRSVIENKEMSTLYQPIWRLENPQPIGFECLTRFSAAPRRPPDEWFTEAAKVGLGAPLEIAAARLGLSALDRLPPDAYVAVNFSPQTILSADLPAMLHDMPTDRIVFEITEHAHVGDYDCLLRALQPFRERGIRVAVDDAGSGYATLHHILQIRPDLIKLDVALTRHIDLDPVRKALAAALVAFARDAGSRIIAEGVETASELSTLRGIGIEKAQGYFLGRPMPIDEAAKLGEQQSSADASRVA